MKKPDMFSLDMYRIWTYSKTALIVILHVEK